MYRAAIDNGHNSISSTDMNWILASSGTVKWASLNSSDTSIAGGAESGSCLDDWAFEWANVYINFSHFNAIAHTADQLQCTAVHEAGHVSGLNHRLSSDVSIMNISHNTRCHSFVIKVVQPSDVTDFNHMY